ncbi:MAG: signal peptidase I [Planctomycetota bacterium]
MNKPTAAAKAETKERNPVVRENIEAFAIAIIMALILKFFCIEAFKIPTGSMQPTLIGADRRNLIDPNGSEIFDRILVNKFIYDLQAPSRWDIIVFQYPLEQTKNYIKRLIGLPSETIEIRDGDIFVDGHIARKPAKVQEVLWRRVDAPHPRQPNEPPIFAKTSSWKVREGDGPTSPQSGQLTLASASGEQTMFFDEMIRDDYLHGYDPDYGIERQQRESGSFTVGDLKLVLTARLEKAQGGLSISILDRDDTYRAFLAAGPSPAQSYIEFEVPRVGEDQPNVTVEETASSVTAERQGNRVVLKGLSLEAGADHRIAFSHADDALELWIDDALTCRIELDLPAPDEPRRTGFLKPGYVSRSGRSQGIPIFGESGIEISVMDNGLVLSDGELYRDVYYLRDSSTLREDPGHFEVPEGHYFAMGDNTQNSKDGRRWETVTLILKDGTRIRGDYIPRNEETPPSEWNPMPIGAQQRIIDVFGESHLVDNDQIVGEPVIETAAYIPERFLLGQAFFVFWPLLSPFRMRFLN